MITSKKTIAPWLAAAGLLSGIAFAAPAQALSTAEFNATSFARLSVLGVSTVPAEPGAELGGLEFNSTPDTFLYDESFGDYSLLVDAGAFEVPDVLPGLPGASDFELEAFAQGSGSSTGGADGGGQAALFLSVFNSTAFVLDLTYQFQYALSASAVAVGTGMDAAAEAYFQLLVNSDSELFTVFADLLLGEATAGDLFTRTFRLNPGDTLELAMLNGVSGQAAPVPLPASLPLLAAALGVLARMRRRQTAPAAV